MDTTEAPSSPSLGHYYTHSSDHSFPLTRLPPQNHDGDDDDNDDNDDFEFSFFPDSPDFSSVSAADDIFLRGQIIPTNPFFRQNDHRYKQDVVVVNAPAETPKRMPLRKLMSEERPSAMTAGCELDGIDAETYCLWTPQHKKPSKRWNFRNLLAHSKRNPKHAATKLVGLFSGAGRSESQTRTK
ncbi:hypothetical protein Fmac_026218 [Flemingia macrophylla]|uniref:Uncharacterized protein n=1 Tax=Flemingia macrophylla TaxID=520843 RepID=A0ABD1LE85_9FABA